MTAFARRLRVPFALWLAPLAAAPFSSAAAAQSGAPSAPPSGQSYSDPYRSGPTRPFDGSPRSGVYATKPVASYETPQRNRGTAEGAGSMPAIWRGLYIGALVSNRWANTDAHGVGVPRLTTKGLQAGGHVGYNFQADSVVLGVEADLMLGGTTSSASVAGTTGTIQDTWTSSVRGRLGYVIGPALLYGTGGVAVAGQDFTVKTGPLATRLNDTRLGYVVGAGFEYKFTPQVTGRVEGLHYSYKDSMVNWSASNLPVRQDSNVLRAGVSLQFN